MVTQANRANMTGVMLNAGPWIGMSGGVAALATIPNPETKLFTCAVMFALAAGSALRKYCFAAPVKADLQDYPFDTRSPNPWQRDGGPAGL